jgi:hypothetical protein
LWGISPLPPHVWRKDWHTSVKLIQAAVLDRVTDMLRAAGDSFCQQRVGG